MSAVVTHRIVRLWQVLQTASHGEKTALCREAAHELGVSLPSVYRRLKEVEVENKRKRRADAGTSDLPRDEALLIAAVLRESVRGTNNKLLYSLDDAVSMLRANGKIRAEKVDKNTGEVKPLSTSAIRRALTAYKLHPNQLMAPAPTVGLVSRHPNHVWQIDASLCVLYYLTPKAGPNANGLQVMDADQFYKNKPKNLARIAADRVWSYEITDHYTGWIYVEYVMGAESSQNLCNVLINAMQERGGADVMHGVPHILMMDPGSANTSVMTKSLCHSLGIRMIVHAPGAARVTGQVENARNIIERSFEARLRFQPVPDLAALNERASKWRAIYNFKAIHSRYRNTRNNLWLTIKQDQLIKAPPVETCRTLAASTPIARKVSPKMTVSFEGDEYLVSHVPNLLVGDTLRIARNPWRDDCVQVLLTNAEGKEYLFAAPIVAKNDAGFDLSGPVIGEEFKRLAETPAQVAQREADRLSMGETTDDAIKAARKQKRIPFNGELDPYKDIDNVKLPDTLPKRGTQHSAIAPVVETPPLSVFVSAKRLQPQFADWSPEHYAWLSKHHAAGVKEDDLAAVAEQLRNAFSKRPTLTVVGGA